jgi:drug/metabolite transporter (DMT)-like permease
MEHRPTTHDRRGVVHALVAATLFGASAPCAKLLLQDVPSVMLAGLLYAGAGVGLGAWWLIQWTGSGRPPGARLGGRDLPWLVAVIAAGGIAAPVMLMWGLARTPASTSALLLNLESVFTALLARFAWRENLDRKVGLGMLAIVAGGVVLAWSGTPRAEVPWGPLAVTAACAAWALDNNLTRRIAAADPVQIAAIKGLIAGATNLTLALLSGAVWPAAGVVAAAGGLGLVSYGLSLVLFILGLRHLGSARTAAYFSSAPFVGAALSIGMLGERPTLLFGAAGLLMAAGLWACFAERHAHLHAHTVMMHDHWHDHDEHHQHAHSAEVFATDSHSHWHGHAPLEHSHPHYPDIHHRHEHGGH